MRNIAEGAIATYKQSYRIDKGDRIVETESNPEAFRNIIGRAIEAHGRGFWNADKEKLEKLRELYESTDDALEGVSI